MGAQDSESIQSLRARIDNSVNMLSDRKTVRKGDTEDFQGSNTSNARKWWRWVSLFLLSVVDEDNLSKFGRICLEIVVPGPLSDVLELGLPTAVVTCWNDDIRVVCISDK